jgi:hypothetical protein
MVLIKRLVLDILKPHQPRSIEFCSTLAEVGDSYAVSLTVVGVDEETETIEVCIEGYNLDFVAIQSAITKMNSSLHSVDVVDVINEQPKISE